MATTKRTGTLETCRDASGRTYFRGKIRLQDTSRVRIEIDAPKCFSKTASRDFVAWAQEQEDLHHRIFLAKCEGNTKREARIASAAGETCDAWFERYVAYQRECGVTDPTKATRWNKWISPRIGSKPIALITRGDIEDIRDVLDGAVRGWIDDGKGKERISGKSAMNVWSCLTSSFKAATSSKRRDLRVLEGKPNPCVGVEPPGDKNTRKARRKTFIRPNEAAQLLACDEIPIEWREVYAIAGYTYLRPGELRVLTWSDIESEMIHVTKAWDYNEEAIKPPKTANGIRHVPVEATLAPLLKRMREGKSPRDLVVPLLSSFGEDHLAESFREHLLAAGLTRPELHTTTRTHVQSNFRSWRDSGLTWLAMTGLGVDKISRRAGHDTIQTTMGYVKQAEDLSGDLGTPFGVLPEKLLGGSEGGKPSFSGPPSGPPSLETPSFLEREKGFETALFTEIPQKPQVDNVLVAPADGLSARDEVYQGWVDRDVDHVERTARANAIDRITRSIEAATSAGRWDFAERLTTLLDRLTFRDEPVAHADVIDLAARKAARARAQK